MKDFDFYGDKKNENADKSDPEKVSVADKTENDNASKSTASSGAAEHESSDDMNGQEAYQQQGGLKDRIAQFKFERIYIAYALCAVILGFAAYLLLSSMFGSKNSHKVKPSTTPAHLDSHFQDVQYLPQPVSVADKSADAATILKLERQVGDLSNAVSVQQKIMVEFVKKWQTEITTRDATEAQAQKTMQAALEKINSNLTAIEKSQKAQVLFSLIDQLKRQLSYMNAREINMADKLHLTAVVDGIAWLEDSKGKTMTVKAGDTLDHYGKVLKVDDRNNKVYTASGYVFN